MTKYFIYILLIFFLALPSTEAFASPSKTDNIINEELKESLLGLGAKKRKIIKLSIQRIRKIGHPAALPALPALEALRDRRLRMDDKKGRVLILNEDGTSARDVITGDVVSIEAVELRTPSINNAVRRALRPVIAQLKLFSSNPEERLSAADDLMKRPSEELRETVKKALEKETVSKIHSVLTVILARIDLSSNDPEKRLEAVSIIRASGIIKFKPALKELLEKSDDGSYLEQDEAVRMAALNTIKSIERKQFFINQAGNLFYGLSLGSVLLLASLGLAITFGLMGVINMAHGEMLMLGAYATYVVQNIFKAYLPGLFDWYLLCAIPAAFVVSGLIGMLLERCVIRYLYGRPLETLLATWGISLILIQTVRLSFGAQNVEVANPSWLSGGVELLEGVVLPYSRIAIIAFVVFVVILVWVLFQRTKLGLNARAVIQNRPMASCMGISTSRVDMLTFGLGSGVAGLGGVALSQIGNVGPELGQLYIVDSFLVVVLGGVGKIAGTVAGAMGIGVVNKFLEPVSGAVLGKIFVLLFIILFIQKRPQGIFALKGRVVES